VKQSPQALDLNALLASISEPLSEVNEWLAQQYQAEHTRIAPLLDHVRRFKGKQIRAAQVLLMGQALENLNRNHIMVAGVLEMVHAATLVHDDLLDGASERRGLDCTHVRWGSHASVLLGDWIYAMAFRRSSEMDDQTCSQALASATAAVCLGEIRQNLSCMDFDLSEQEYLDQIDGKTGALFEAGGRLAAYYAGGDLEVQNACARYGLLAGRAFQMMDDVLDLVGDQQRVKKSLGTDWANGKMTLPLIRLRDSLPDSVREHLRESFGSGQPRSILLEGEFAGAMESALTMTRLEISGALDEACSVLSILPIKGPREHLIDLTRFLGQRNR
jgi:octaprenyl-diphosphate synthase